MRFISAVVLFSATVYASQHWNEGKGYNNGDYEKETAPTPTPVQEYPAPDYTPPPCTSEVPVHETQAVEEPPAAHTTAPPSYEVDVKPPPEGPKTHTVTVGGDAGLVYTPAEIIADIGDTVHFMFLKQNHSVTQSTFDKPCNRLATGEDSGLMPNLNNTVVPAPAWEYIVKEKEPTWWYCKQRTGTHCGKGMVFAINPNAEKTFNMFKEKAIQINGTAAITTTAPAPEKTVVDISTTVTMISEPSQTNEVVQPPVDTPTPVEESPVDTPTPPAPVDKPYMTPGWNEGGNPGACNCACFCGVSSFPQGDGWGHYGGKGGSLPAPW